MNVKVKKLHRDAIIPKRQTELASGFDLYVLDACNLRFLDSPYDIQFYEYFLKPGEKPEAVFEAKGQKATAREYCSVHGLWKSAG